MAPGGFRFGVSGQRASRVEWEELARKAEDLGYSTLLLPDHFGRQMSPLPALQAAAHATQRLRVGTIVLDNDFRHPAMLAKDVATMNVLTDGRVELGIGAGWMEVDYRKSGLPFDPPAVRVARLEEAVQIIRRLFDGGPVTFRGQYYEVENLEGYPKPTEKIPLLIAGSRKRMLRLAASYADIVGIEDHQFAERATGSAEVHPAVAGEQVKIVREAAGERYPDLELNVFAARVEVTDRPEEATEAMAAQLQTTPQAIQASASFLIGSVDGIVETLQRRREEWHLSYIMVFDRVMDVFAPVVARLGGT
ncbi:MAG TPA: TIGR03621 family F420-dependent LLM class oxidoreductase [Chloroflexota bacterium]|nr:TIGR03621 family F420-dependent LLM class oxidoreductase [Chloroflexota bacterium]